MDSQLSLPQGEAGPHTDTWDSDEVKPMTKSNATQ